MEITPPAVGVHLFGPADNEMSSLSPQVEVRALVEGQFLSRRLHAERLGYSIRTRVLATGGASSNKDILQVLSDVFNAPNAPEAQLVTTPHAAAQQVYDQMLKRYARLEERVLQKTRP
ncbi:Xylulose kinase [Liparis tanakae]|uniref:Xylulose kinase n=1 Tax=Liparis tanakae TaxID=230148 RepID=A0A4Z2E6T9_9TELE|nr:Xylulose kinase [Liparis tanakae]